MGTPARRVLFESHRDGRMCRVARDSSSSDSSLLRMLLARLFSLSFCFECTSFRPLSREPLTDPTDGDCSAECPMRSTIAPPHIRARAHIHTHTRVFWIEIGTWQTQNRESRSERPRSSSTRISSRGKSLPTIVVSLTIAKDRLVDILRLDPATLQRIFSVGQSTLQLSLSRSR